MMRKKEVKTREETLHRLDSIDYHSLMWKQMGFGVREFELRSNETLLGRLYWPKLLSDRAVAESGDGKWIFDRVGFFRQEAIATEATTGLEVASFTFGWLGDGELTLANGHRYQLYGTGFLSNDWVLADENNEALITMREGRSWFKYDAELELQVGAVKMPELPLMLFMSWYLVYMRLQDSAAAAAAASAAS
jgi:hypothetical protein